MGDWWFGIPPPLLLFLVVFGGLFLLWLLDKGLGTLLDIIVHGWFILFGGHPKHAPDRMKKLGGYNKVMLVLAFLLYIVVIIVLPTWEFIKIGLLISGIALLLVLLVLRFGGAEDDYFTRPIPRVKRLEKKELLSNQIHLFVDYRDGTSTCFCQACGQGYDGATWDAEEQSVQCERCNAWFCSEKKCLTLLSESGKCSKCGSPFSPKQKKRLQSLMDKESWTRSARKMDG